MVSTNLILIFFTGAAAANNRSAMVGIIHRYFAGDKSILKEIEANAKSNHPIAQMARDSLPARDDLDEKKRRRAMEDADLQGKRIANISAFTTLMTTLDPDWTNDTRLVLQTQDLLKSTVFNSKTLPAVANVPDLELITLSQYAQDNGLPHSNKHLMKVGRILADKYRDKHGREPSKHKQHVDGAVRLVNSYSEQDYDLIDESFVECQQ